MKFVPSGMVSLTNCAKSQTGVAEAEMTCDVADGMLTVGGGAPTVLLGSGGGKVSVATGVCWLFSRACTVSAAFVEIAPGSSVGVAFDGRLHAERIKTITINRLDKTLNLDM